MSLLDIANIGSLLNSGLVNQFGPTIAKGLITEAHKKGKFNVDIIICYVREDIALWDTIPLEYRQKVQGQVKKIGRLDWLTTEWLLQSQREEIPEVCSLFLGWPEAMTWLDKQIREIKANLRTPVT